MRLRQRKPALIFFFSSFSLFLSAVTLNFPFLPPVSAYFFRLLSTAFSFRLLHLFIYLSIYFLRFGDKSLEIEMNVYWSTSINDTQIYRETRGY